MDNEKIGKFIAELRKEKQLTQKALAARLNITDKAVSKWERGLSCPDISLLPTITEVLEVSISELLNGERSDSVSEDTEVIVDQALGYAEKTVKDRRKILQAIYTISYSAIFLLSIIVCSICDLAVSGAFTWSLYPISSIIFAWLVTFPIVKWGAKGLILSLVSLSVLIVPFLYVLDNIINGDISIMPIGVRMAAIGIVFMWGLFAIIKKLKKRRLLATAAALLFTIPICLAIYASLAKVLGGAIIDVWDFLNIGVLAIMSILFFLLDYIKKNR